MTLGCWIWSYPPDIAVYITFFITDISNTIIQIQTKHSATNLLPQMNYYETQWLDMIIGWHYEKLAQTKCRILSLKVPSNLFQWYPNFKCIIVQMMVILGPSILNLSLLSADTFIYMDVFYNMAKQSHRHDPTPKGIIVICYCEYIHHF